MRCSKPGRARQWPTAAPAARRAGTAGTPRRSPRTGMLDLDLRQVGVLRNPPRLGAVGDVAVGEQHARASCSARPTARLPARCRSNRPGCWPRSPASGTRRCGRTAPATGRPARSSSANRCDGPPRCTLMTIIGSSVITARPMRFALERDARPAAGRDRHRPGERGADRRGHRRDFVLGLEREHVEILVLGQLVQNVAGRRDRIAPRNSRLPLSRAAVIRPQASAVLPMMLVYLPGGQLGLRHVELRVDRLDRFAVVVAGLERGRVGLGDFRPCGRTSRR